MNPFELVDPLQQDRYIKILQIIMRHKNNLEFLLWAQKVLNEKIKTCK